MEIVKVNVPYFYSVCYNKDATLQERFIGLFNEDDSDKAKLLIRGDKDMEELYNKILENSDDEIIGLYDIESHRREVERSVREEAVEEGYSEGLEKGLEKGIEQGIKQGIEQGIKQRNIDIAKNMIKENIDIAIISKVTGLSVEDIKKLP